MHKVPRRLFPKILRNHCFRNLSEIKFAKKLKFKFDFSSIKYLTISTWMIINEPQIVIKLHKNRTKNMGWKRSATHSINLLGIWKRNYTLKYVHKKHKRSSCLTLLHLSGIERIRWCAAWFEIVVASFSRFHWSASGCLWDLLWLKLKINSFQFQWI